MDQTGNRHIFDRHHNFVRDRLAVVRAIVIAGDFAADHQLLEALLIHIRALYRGNVIAIAQNCDGIGHSQDLREIVRNKDHCIALAPDAVHLLVKLFTAFLGERGRRLIDDDDLRSEISSFYDLDQLAVLEIVVLDHRIRFDPVKTVFLKKRVGFFVHGVRVLDAELDEALLMSEENILRHGQAVKGTQFLDNDRDAFVIGLYLVVRMDFFSVEDKLSAVLLVNAGQRIGERRFA